MKYYSKAVVHVALARHFNNQDLYGASVQRAYAFWVIFRAWTKIYNRPWMFEDEAIDLLVSHTKKTRPTCRRWLQAGVDNGLYVWGTSKHRRTISLVGLRRVCEQHLNGAPPEHALEVKWRDLLNPSLQYVRAILHHTFCGKKAVIRSRIFLSQSMGRTEQTSRNYSRRINLRLYRKPMYYAGIMPYTGYKGIAQRAPNMYIGTSIYNPKEDNQAREWDESSLVRGYLPTNPLNKRHLRRYYHSQEQAQREYNHRVRRDDYDPHTFFISTLQVGERNYDILHRIAPYSDRELPKESYERDDAIMMKEGYDEDARIGRAIAQREMSKKPSRSYDELPPIVREHDAHVQQTRINKARGRMAKVTMPNSLPKPKRMRMRMTQEPNHPLSMLTEVQQNEILYCNPSLALLLVDMETGNC